MKITISASLSIAQSLTILALLSLGARSVSGQVIYSVTEVGAYASGINNNGQVVGAAVFTSGGSSHAFLYSGGTMTDLGTLGGETSWASGINNKGQVVGAAEYYGSSGFHAFLYSEGVMFDLGTFGGWLSQASAINDNGQAVGEAATADHFEAFLYT